MAQEIKGIQTLETAAFSSEKWNSPWPHRWQLQKTCLALHCVPALQQNLPQCPFVIASIPLCSAFTLALEAFVIIMDDGNAIVGGNCK